MSKSYLETIRKYYPQAHPVEPMWDEITVYLQRIGIDPKKVLVANSVCSDDVNSMQFSIPEGKMLGTSHLGGLGGFPFTGLTGLKAFADHMPEDGALLIYYGPHIGITKNGVIGKIHRAGQSHDSDCCDATHHALKKIREAHKLPTVFDFQEDMITELFKKNKKRILDAPHHIQEATEVMFEAIDKRLRLLISKSKDAFKGKHLILVSAVFINVDEGQEACVANRVFESTNLHTNEVRDHLKEFGEHLASV